MGFYAAQNVIKRYPPPFSWFERWVFLNSRFAFAVSADGAHVLRVMANQVLDRLQIRRGTQSAARARVGSLLRSLHRVPRSCLRWTAAGWVVGR